MGLLYPFAIDEAESDHVTIKDSTILIKTYGLPYIFWGYLAALLIFLSVMALAIYRSLLTMLKSTDALNSLIAYSTITFFFLTIIGFFTLFIIEFRIFKKEKTLVKSVHILGLCIKKRTYQLDKNSFEIENLRGTPNIARQKSLPGTTPMQNRGYFELYCKDVSGEKILLDRHSRKNDLQKLQNLLEKSC